MTSDASNIILPGGSVFLASAPYARGEKPGARGVLRATPEDFYVDEIMPIDLEGEGEHLWLHVEKTGLTTPQAASTLAAHYGVRPRDIGYAGLKDRWARTRQWFSVPVPATAPLPPLPHGEGLLCLAAERHRRKLRRGAHGGNRFELKLREFRGDRDAVATDLERIGRKGCPNYFGEQRFGRNDGNLDLARGLFGGRRMRRGTQRGMALSAARSDLFNAVLAARVADGSWDCLLDGEAAALDGSRSVFAVENAADDTLQERLAAFDIHPSGPLPGRGDETVTGAVATLEASVLAPYAAAVEALVGLGVEAARRALRVRPENLAWEWPDAETLTLGFELPRGAFATVVLREILSVES